MVSFNMLWKLCVVVAFGYSATATDISQEQPKRESLESGFFHKNDKPSTGLPKVEEPPMYSVEWYLLPKPENRATLRDRLPWSLSISVPKNCNVRISPAVENRIKWYFSWRELQWFLLPKPENRAALLELLPSDVAALVSKDCNKPVTDIVENYIWKYFTFYAADWLMLPRPESRACLREELPSDLAAKVPEDCNELIDPEVENSVREYFSLYLNKEMFSRLHTYCHGI